MPLLVCAAALILRLWRIDLTQFEDDQAALLSGAVHFVSTGRIPLTSGLSFTVGVRHPPLVTLLLALPVRVTHNPIGAAAFTALGDALAAALVALTAARLRGLLAGISAGALYAVLPAALIYGRRIWNPDFVPFFSALALYATVTFWQTRRPAWLATALVALACATQLHLAAGSLLVVWLAVAIVRWRDLRWQPFAMALGIVLLVLSPYLYLQTQSRWSDFFGVVRFLGQPKHTDFMALDTAVTLAGSDLYRQLALPAGQATAAFQHDLASWLLAGLALVGLGWGLWWRKGDALIVASWAVVPLLLSLRHTLAVEPHYLLCMLPAIAVLQGLAMRALRWVWLVGAATLAIVGWQLAAYLHFQAFVARAGPDSSYGMPLRYELAAARAARQADTPGSTIYIANADSSAGAFDYLLAGMAPTKHFDGQYTFVFPRGPAWYISQGGQHAYAFLTSLAGAPSSTVRLVGGQPAFGLFHLAAGAEQRYQAGRGRTPLGRASVDHAVDLMSLSAPRLAAGHRSTVTLEWRVTNSSAATGSELRQFGHLTDAGGRTWSTNTDFRGFPRPEWSTGDIVLSWFDLNILPSAPRGGYWFDTGFYQPVSNQRLPVYSGNREIGTSLRVGPVKVDGRAPPPPAAIRPLATWSGGIALLAGRWQPGSVSLDWYAKSAQSRSATAFVHVLSASGTVLAQHDGPPVMGTYPTTLWAPGELIRDAHPISGPVRPGTILEVGWYTQPGTQRIPVQLGPGQGPAGSALLLRVGPGGELMPLKVG